MKKITLKNSLPSTMIFVALLSVLCLILCIKSTSLRRYLEKSQKVNADLLVIEAWLPDDEIAIVKKEILQSSYDYIVTTGIESEELDFCQVAMNGYLIFYPDFSLESESESKLHMIDVVARSEMSGIYCSHFNLYINDSLVADFNADEMTRKYSVEWFGNLNEIDSLAVQFTNDYFDETGDRNLYVKEFIIDSEFIIPYQFNSVYDIGNPGGNNKIINDFKSHPERLRNKLIASGIDPSKVFAVTGKRTNINRTLNGALAFQKWLEKTNISITGINIITMSIHARRTWLTYKRVIDNSSDIGIIPLPATSEMLRDRLSRIETIAETLSLIYYWIILLPY